MWYAALVYTATRMHLLCRAVHASATDSSQRSQVRHSDLVHAVTECLASENVRLAASAASTMIALARHNASDKEFLDTVVASISDFAAEIPEYVCVATFLAGCHACACVTVLYYVTTETTHAPL
mgnify:CR=1 FL=1